ncbi:MAG: hypothetical protein JWP67_1371 [Mucilaginibacter sp.]|nr:hypothetical protein [Mucilaginibacter sp.]MDB5285422.1 hypothetical protein [Mucilaginibacter sp.]
MEDYKKKLGSLADKIKNEPPQTPIQQVLPIKPQLIRYSCISGMQ